MALSVTSVASELPTLSGRALALLAARKPSPVELYLWIAGEVLACDLRSPPAADVQRRFNGFYGVRRNQVWRSEFYRIFEAAKGRQAPPVELFRWSLAELHQATGRIEASFVSKLVATLHPKAPVIDSVIRTYLSARLEAPPFGGNLATAGEYFDWLSDVFERLSGTVEADDWCALFDEAFDGVDGAAAIHRVKKVDFLIWAGSR